MKNIIIVYSLTQWTLPHFGFIFALLWRRFSTILVCVVLLSCKGIKLAFYFDSFSCPLGIALHKMVIPRSYELFSFYERCTIECGVACSLSSNLDYFYCYCGDYQILFVSVSLCASSLFLCRDYHQPKATFYLSCD